MKKQSLPLYLLSAVILASAILVSCRLPGRNGNTNPPAEPPAAAGTAAAGGRTLSPSDAYRLEKLNAVSDMILERQVVPESYFHYLDGELAQAVADYNRATGELSLTYTNAAAGIVNALQYEHETSPGDYQQPDLYYAWIDRIAKYALYPNPLELCRRDGLLSYTLAKEAGGSYGLWAGMLHGDYVDGSTREAVQNYFAQCDALLDRLDAARGALG